MTQSNIVEGSLNSPLTAYSQERLVLSVPWANEDGTLVFGIQSVDAANNTSPLSNLVTARLQKPEELPKSNDTIIYIIVGLSVGVLIIAIIVISIIIVSKKKGKNGKNGVTKGAAYANNAYSKNEYA